MHINKLTKEEKIRKKLRKKKKSKYKIKKEMKNRIKNSKTISNIKEIGEDGLIHLKTGEVASLIEVKAIDLSLTSNQEKTNFFHYLKNLYQIRGLNLKCYKINQNINLNQNKINYIKKIKKFNNDKIKKNLLEESKNLIDYLEKNNYTSSSIYYWVVIAKNIDELEKVLDEMEKKVTPYKEQILNHSMSFHEILTLASLVELEGVTLDNRKNIASVFMNRINSNMSLGSDVTTYYGVKVDMGERDLYSNELDSCNSYNTRCATFKGLPVSPIANPSLDSIISVIEPIVTDYYYFVADKNRKIYFNKNIDEHNNTINRLKNSGLWFEY